VTSAASNRAIGTLRKPLLYAVAKAAEGVVTLVELPAGTGHGWDTVIQPGDPSTPSEFAGRLEKILGGLG